jgi:aspartate 1-decarboxylase
MEEVVQGHKDACAEQAFPSFKQANLLIMKIQMLKSKLQQVIVTESNIDYKGSITIDPNLMEAAGFYPYERVEVNNSTNGHRITTYVIPGERGSGCVKMNGGAALHANVGDKVHMLSYCERELPIGEVYLRFPKIVHTNKKNSIIKISEGYEPSE